MRAVEVAAIRKNYTFNQIPSLKKCVVVLRQKKSLPLYKTKTLAMVNTTACLLKPNKAI